MMPATKAGFATFGEHFQALSTFPMEKNISGRPHIPKKKQVSSKRVPRRFRKISATGGLQVWGQRWTRRSESVTSSTAQAGELHLKGGSLTYTPQELPATPHLAVVDSSSLPTHTPNTNSTYDSTQTVTGLLYNPSEGIGLTNFHSPVCITQPASLDLNVFANLPFNSNSEAYSLLNSTTGYPRPLTSSTTETIPFYPTAIQAGTTVANHQLGYPPLFQPALATPFRQQVFEEAELTIPVQQPNLFPTLGLTRDMFPIDNIGFADIDLGLQTLVFPVSEVIEGPWLYPLQSSHNYMTWSNEATMEYVNTSFDHSQFMPGYVSSSGGIPLDTFFEPQHSYSSMGYNIHSGWDSNFASNDGNLSPRSTFLTPPDC